MHVLFYKENKRYYGVWDTVMGLLSLLHHQRWTWQCGVPRQDAKRWPRPYLDRGCPGGQAEACPRAAAHPWEEHWRSPRGWLLSVGCGPPHPSVGTSHLGAGRKEQQEAVGPGAQQPTALEGEGRDADGAPDSSGLSGSHHSGGFTIHLPSAPSASPMADPHDCVVYLEKDTSF